MRILEYETCFWNPDTKVILVSRNLFRWPFKIKWALQRPSLRIRYFPYYFKYNVIYLWNWTIFNDDVATHNFWHFETQRGLRGLLKTFLENKVRKSKRLMPCVLVLQNLIMFLKRKIIFGCISALKCIPI